MRTGGVQHHTCCKRSQHDGGRVDGRRGPAVVVQLDAVSELDRVGIAHVLDVHILGQAGVIRTAVVFWALANNGLSIIENSTHLGLPVPEQLKLVLEQLHDRAEKSGTDESDGG